MAILKYILAFLLVIIITSLLYLYADREVATYFFQIDRSDPLKSFFAFITRFGRSEWFLVPSFVLFVWFRYRKKSHYAKQALYVFVTNVIAGLGVWLFKFPFGRMRPKLYLEHHRYGFEWFEVTSKYVSFPSGHAITAIASAVALGLLFPKWRYLIWSMGTLIAFSRVVVTAHYLSDVFFASVLGTLVAVTMYRYYFKEIP